MLFYSYFLCPLNRVSDVVRAVSEAIRIVSAGHHDRWRAYERIKGMYDWSEIGEYTITDLSVDPSITGHSANFSFATAARAPPCALYSHNYAR